MLKMQRHEGRQKSGVFIWQRIVAPVSTHGQLSLRQDNTAQSPLKEPYVGVSFSTQVYQAPGWPR